MPSPLIAPLLAFANRLRFKTLFFITAGLFVLNLIIPDFIPAIDEILLGLATLLLANWQKRPQDDPQRPPIDVTPNSSSKK